MEPVKRPSSRNSLPTCRNSNAMSSKHALPAAPKSARRSATYCCTNTMPLFPSAASCSFSLPTARSMSTNSSCPHLKKGKIVLCDRFNDSTIAYQGGARGFTEDLVRKLCDFACDGLKPDLTLYLDLDPKIGFERAKKQA